MGRNRTNLVLGLLLILLGAWMIATNQIPELQRWMNLNFSWPMWVIGAGALILVIGLLVGAPGMAVPASIVAGIGGILYYQNTTGLWESWSYMWTLIPGFVGVGTILSGLLGENTRRNLGEGLRLLLISGVLFVVFGTFLGHLNLLGVYGAPILLIALGVWVIARGLMRRSNT